MKSSNYCQATIESNWDFSRVLGFRQDTFAKQSKVMFEKIYPLFFGVAARLLVMITMTCLPALHHDLTE
jgi:hypothetical protein